MKIKPKSKLPFDWVNNTDETPLLFQIIDNTKNITVVEDYTDEDLIDHTRQDIEFIVHACNNYEKLVEALKMFIELDDLNVSIEIHAKDTKKLLKELGEIE